MYINPTHAPPLFSTLARSHPADGGYGRYLAPGGGYRPAWPAPARVGLPAGVFGVSRPGLPANPLGPPAALAALARGGYGPAPARPVMVLPGVFQRSAPAPAGSGGQIVGAPWIVTGRPVAARAR